MDIIVSCGPTLKLQVDWNKAREGRYPVNAIVSCGPQLKLRVDWNKVQRIGDEFDLCPGHTGFSAIIDSIERGEEGSTVRCRLADPDDYPFLAKHLSAR